VPVAAKSVIFLGPVCVFAAIAYINTGEQIIGVPGSELEFTNPDGSRYLAVIKSGETFVVVRKFGNTYARIWRERQGYALAPVTVN
jgi:hypothetical protein